MFRPIYNGLLQTSVLGGVVNTIVIRAIRDLVSRAHRWYTRTLIVRITIVLYLQHFLIQKPEDGHCG
jgi:hypothetical protein